LNWVSGDVCGFKPEVYEYLQFAIALLAEDLITRMYQGLFGKSHGPFSQTVSRNLGRLWVFAVMLFVEADADIMMASCEAAVRRAKRLAN
jgi:hypothetical protein